ncbi:hypothetical protein SAMN05443144_102115 [Fodinibius roseus]|uniref:Uncharacterized protein n=1 Tax=Fodinibius roseus TaxID=1194090 RepID=A0A1M4USI3_9BACT|nr:hypothetical protein SAMN05443144_102115 [Fodinibius roseus]
MIPEYNVTLVTVKAGLFILNNGVINSKLYFFTSVSKPALESFRYNLNLSTAKNNPKIYDRLI